MEAAACVPSLEPQWAACWPQVSPEAAQQVAWPVNCLLPTIMVYLQSPFNSRPRAAVHAAQPPVSDPSLPSCKMPLQERRPLGL